MSIEQCLEVELKNDRDCHCCSLMAGLIFQKSFELAWLEDS